MSGEEPYEMRSGTETLEALDQAGKGVQAAATELSKLAQHFYEARIDEHGEIKHGTGLQYDIAIKEEIATIYDLALNNEQRPPPADVRAAKAERAIRIKNPGLWAEYHAKKARIDALKTWIVNMKAAISANQSVRKAEAP